VRYIYHRLLLKKKG